MGFTSERVSIENEPKTYPSFVSRKVNSKSLFFQPKADFIPGNDYVDSAVHTNGPGDDDKEKETKPKTPCPNSVSIGALKEFNHSNLSPDDQEKWGTYLGVTSQMSVGPGPDHTGHCMKEALKTVSNDCPKEVYTRDGKETEPCTGNKCLDINRYGSSGDASTGSSLPDGKTSFIDLHRTRSAASLLEGTGKTSCSVVCEQVYTCDRQSATTGKFTITRNFKADSFTRKDSTKKHITTGSVKKELIP